MSPIVTDLALTLQRLFTAEADDAALALALAGAEVTPPPSANASRHPPPPFWKTCSTKPCTTSSPANRC